MRFNLIYFLLLIFVSCVDGEEILGDCYVSAEPDAVCIEIYEPVCACNNVVYGNSCKAKKAGNLSWKSTSLASGEECKY
ncbi:hypothetical protein N8867_04850 [Flavobacteriaceae bacterium]|jgi:hypothetical protein|nr:kazal domain protein [Flavobacteriaceae bacterium]MBT4232195.1 kazal domain protein [Flavobacteriaceae bacterium]MDA7731499.1 hypothetical protein [Flavobacteriaceae bacterium]MDA9001690.1 hypothetical protein [Flavobacteriaceae bacterium]MDA9865933.1 hypothetical protein [Flavobacteriaceae bacterium]